MYVRLTNAVRALLMLVAQSTVYARLSRTSNSSPLPRLLSTLFAALLTAPTISRHILSPRAPSIGSLGPWTLPSPRRLVATPLHVSTF
jgi:hypothetical protein